MEGQQDVLWLGLALLPHNVAPRPPWDLLFEHEACVAARRDAEDVVEFLQSPLLRFGQEEEDHEEGDNVQTGRWIVSEGDLKGGNGGWWRLTRRRSQKYRRM